jgi:putative Mg2+ transporter-C (MgtC) family protein
MIDTQAIKARFEALAPHLNERTCRTPLAKNMASDFSPALYSSLPNDWTRPITWCPSRMISNIDILARLAVAALLGSLVGLERERLLWAAGIRTHMMVSVGACLLMIVSAYGFQHALMMDHVVLDPSRIAAQVVSGIGFLGAGSILARGQVVRGLTTAASVWSVAAIGLASGGGMFFAAGLTTAIILVILAGVKPLEDAYRARIQSYILKVRSERAAFAVEDLKSMLAVRGGQIKRVLTAPGTDELDDTTIYLVRVSQRDIRAGADRLRDAPGIHSVEVIKRKRGAPDIAE